MRIANQPVEIGDTLFDVVSLEHVKVIAVGNGVADVQTKTSIVRIKEGGKLGRVKRYYWHNPIAIEPKKEDGDRMIRLRKIAKEIR